MTTKSSIRDTENVLSVLFGSKARGQVLRVFLIDPGRAYYQRQLETAAGLPIRAVQREVERLSGAGLLYSRAEGNRMYYQADPDFPLFPELRAMVVKTLPPEDALRASLATEPSVRLAFLSQDGQDLLVVLRAGETQAPTLPGTVRSSVLSSEAFLAGLEAEERPLDVYLRGGADLLGRRDDPVWRRIDAAGYDIPKGKGVP